MIKVGNTVRICARHLSDSGIQGYGLDIPPYKWQHKPWLPKKDRRIRGTPRKMTYAWTNTVHHRVKPFPVKGTFKMKLDRVKPESELLHWSSDPVKHIYAYQLTPYLISSSDAIPAFCALTQTAYPNQLISLLDDNLDAEIFNKFLQHATETCHQFNATLSFKSFSVPPKTVLQKDIFCSYYASSFLLNMVQFLYKFNLSDNSHITCNQHTGAFWRVRTLEKRDRFDSFQLMNHIDLMIRTDSPITYSNLRSMEVVAEPFEGDLRHVTHAQLHLFRQRRKVYQYPGYLKETFYPHNHTVFKVVNSTLSDEEMRCCAVVTGFGQSFASVQYQCDFPVIVDQIPQVKHPSACQVIVTDGQRYCFGVYQCNTTDTNQLFEPGYRNMCALSDVYTLIDPQSGELNEELLGVMLKLLTYNKDEIKLESVNNDELVSQS